MNALQIILTVIGSIIGFVLLVIIIILASKVKAHVGYNGKAILVIRFLFIRYSIADEHKKNPTVEKIIAYYKSLPLDCQVGIVTDVLKKFIAKLYFDDIDIDITVASDDAAQTALLYGQVNAAVWPIVGFIDGKNRLKNKNIAINADFNEKKGKCKIFADISVRAIHGLICLLYIWKTISKRKAENK